VHEQVFSEEQLFSSDVRGEDDEDVGEKQSAATSSSSTASTAATASESKRSPKALKAADDKSNASTETTAVVASGGVDDAGKIAGRRKRAADRANKVMFWLESKYDLLPEVCTSYDHWKEAPSSNSDFDLLWCDCAIPADRFMKLKSYQKMNHFVGMSSITRKNNLGRNLLRMRKQFPKEYKFFPDTWILPTDLSDFKQQFSASKNKTFIIKPDNGCQGKGIYLIRDVEKVPVDFSTTYVAQRYIHRPLLLDGFKFDLRLYVLVAGCDPLRIFLHRRGLVRLASEPYVEPAGKNLQSMMVHLTNYAINKMNPNFEENTNPDDAQDGHKRSWEAVQEHLKSEGHDVDTLNMEIEDLIIKTLIAVQPSLSHFYRSCQPDDVDNCMCFEILGFDVMLDYKLQPWLLEVNHAPSFAAESELDRVVKEEVLRNSFELLGVTPDARRQKKREAREKMEQRAMGVKKQPLEERAAQERDGALQRTEWEDAQLQVNGNGYKRLYPSLEKEKDYWQVHEAAVQIWEMLMGGTSRRSVRLTEPEDLPAPQNQVRVGTAKNGGKDGEVEEEKKEAPKRTPEEIREVVDRLMAGCSARPRKSSRRRGSGAKEGEETDPPGAQTADGSPSAEEKTSPPAPVEKRSRPEVQVGDVIKVQTNLGWETVTVRAKRNTGKIDIQFKDGEYMRSVLPRILRESSAPEGEKGAEAAISSTPDTPPQNVNSEKIVSAASAATSSTGSTAMSQRPAPLVQTSTLLSPNSPHRGQSLPPAVASAVPPLSGALNALAHFQTEVQGPTWSPGGASSTSEDRGSARGQSSAGDGSAHADGTDLNSTGSARTGYNSGDADGQGASRASAGYAPSGSSEATGNAVPAAVARPRVSASVNVPGQMSPVGVRHEARLRSHLQQLISVRPIVVPRGRSGGLQGLRGASQGPGGLGNGLLSPGHLSNRPEVLLGLPPEQPSLGSKQMHRRRTFGDN